jgi:acyl-coenzyme A thioesterase PaaI-like protein
VTIEPASADLAAIRQRTHGNCVVCSSTNKRGLGLEFGVSPDGGVEAVFGCDKVFEGYTDFVHGGVISSLLDGAMTNCIFAHGYVAITAELKVRFQQPLEIGKPATVRAWIDRYYRPLYYVKAEIKQDAVIKATAEGKFLESPLLEKQDDGVEA